MAKFLQRALLALGAAVVVDVAAQADFATCPMPVENASCTGMSTVKGFLDWMSTYDYDKSALPLCGNETHKGPVVVETYIEMEGVGGIDPAYGTVRISGKFHAWWKDERLAFNEPCLKSVELLDYQSSVIWKPDLYIDNLVQSHSGRKASIWTVYADGRVHQKLQFSWTVLIDFDLGQLPEDYYYGTVKIGSYAHGISEMRVIPYGGRVGASSSGIALLSKAPKSPIWKWLDAEVDGDQFETEGKQTIEFSDSWDYTHAQWSCRRKPAFFQAQVIFPAQLFNLVSYIQFWIDPVKAAPARAAIAVIPVLILTNLGNSVYKELPQGGNVMWLTDYLMCTMMLCVIAAAEFGLVMHARTTQDERQERLTGFRACRTGARNLFKIADRENISLHELLKRVQAVPVPDSDPPLLEASEISTKDKVEEYDVLFIHYAVSIFESFDADDSGFVSPPEIRKACSHFNLYFSDKKVAKMACMFLRDEGEGTPEDEMSVQMGLTNFMEFLMEWEKYSLASGGSFNLRWQSWLHKFQGMSPMRMWDNIFRVIFPVLMIFQVIIFAAIMHLY